MMRLEGKVAIVTGATGGIGGATVRKLLDEGASVMLAGRDGDRLAALAAALEAGDRVATCAGQPAAEDDVAALVAATVERFGRLDAFVANAGSEGRVMPLTATSLEDFEAVQRTNINSVFLAIKHAAPAMQETGGAIVAISSVAGVVGVPGIGAYAASKHAICGLARVAALELAPARIRVNCVAPAPIDNAMMQSIEGQASPGDPSAARTGFTALIAMGRYGTNEEVANLVAFLASDEAVYCTGGVYPVDGGFLAA
ncbi:SDR family NAD(P)-dependent oxidoreductase [Erythrobacter sp. HL-111]|uniref:SDR family NAD(P)-dependent oxidoreductase n=1 Tax=Erythrobacter sp. HL-111 TaxID=1798193 RepID=UPI0006DA95D6|nr:glucose 1-dehydrogenase [Erythrobacter sp. HL-111]KPP92614.1 MAG: Dehydrogenase [Erythrobacteraceae bacterium HL-111]SDS94499.1 NAD(P)-dependent dehydrogenase, short-chain alcohol dehydrogenase family [Erythrobacter sp. HL-111]